MVCPVADVLDRSDTAAGVNRSLTNASREREGEELLGDLPYSERVKAWMWENRVAVSLVGVFFVAYGAVLGYQGLMRVGVVEGYKPNQPIKFIHSVHVCENEVDCKYCHQRLRIEARRHSFHQRLYELPQGGEEGPSLRRTEIAKITMRSVSIRSQAPT